LEAIEKAGHKGKIEIGMDVAASEFYNAEEKVYDLDFKNEKNDGSKKLTSAKLREVYEGYLKKYPIVTIEDPYD